MRLSKTIDFFFLLTLFSLPFYLWKFDFFFFPTNGLELFALVSIFLFFVQKKKAVFFALRENLQPILFPFLLLFSGLIFSFLFSTQSLAGLGIIKGWFVIPFVFSLCLPTVFNNHQKIFRAVQVLYLSVFSVALISLGYKLTGSLTFDQRLSGFYLSPNQLAMFLSLGLFLGTYLFLEEKNKTLKYSLSLSIFSILIAFYFTYSYASWLAVFLSFLLLLAYKKSSKKITLFLFSGLTLLFCLFFLFQQNNPKLTHLLDSRSSLSSRLMIWNSSWKMIQNHPFSGIGPGNFQSTYLEYQKYFPPYLEWAVPQPHNLYLAFYLQTGLLGLLGFLLLCLKWFSLGLEQKNTTFSVVSLGILFYLLVHGLVDTPYWKNDLAYSFWVIFFLVLAFTRYLKTDQKSNL